MDSWQVCPLCKSFEGLGAIKPHCSVCGGAKIIHIVTGKPQEK